MAKWSRNKTPVCTHQPKCYCLFCSQNNRSAQVCLVAPYLAVYPSSTNFSISAWITLQLLVWKRLSGGYWNMHQSSWQKNGLYWLPYTLQGCLSCYSVLTIPCRLRLKNKICISQILQIINQIDVYLLRITYSLRLGYLCMLVWHKFVSNSITSCLSLLGSMLELSQMSLLLVYFYAKLVKASLENSVWHSSKFQPK